MLELIPLGWELEPAATSFARCYNGEGSYYCPRCHSNQGSVWLGDESWRPTKMQALCQECRQVMRLPSDPGDTWKPCRDVA